MPTTVVTLLTTVVLGLTPGARPPEKGVDRPVLTLSATAPLDVSGRGFGAGEVVRLVASNGAAQRRRTAIASSKGRLRITFELRLSRCAELTVRAVGSLGSRAVLHRASSCEAPNQRRVRR